MTLYTPRALPSGRNTVDVLLNCYPMTGGIGMIEALHMGVPAVSMEGSAIQLRVGSSHLHAVGLDDLRVKSVNTEIIGQANIVCCILIAEF